LHRAPAVGLEQPDETLAFRHPGELQQQSIRVVELGAVTRPGVQFPDVGRAEVVALNRRPQLLKSELDAAEIEVLVEKQAHVAEMQEQTGTGARMLAASLRATVAWLSQTAA